MADVSLKLGIYIRHTGCPEQAVWREKNNVTGWPVFVPKMSERYNAAKIWLECEACGTDISHSTVHTDDVEST